MKHKLGAPRLLADARVYLSGPMDFVASREDEMRFGWRHRVGDLLRALGATVFDPWFKPEVRGLHEYGKETAESTDTRESWTFAQGLKGSRARARCTGQYWETLHVDLRMVDTSDFVIGYCPTNIYSVGTPHEIALARQQRKPVLFVSPPVEFPALDALRGHLATRKDAKGAELLETLVNEAPIKPNPRGIPSLWYMPLVGGESFFDGFGFEKYRKAFPQWGKIRMDDSERQQPPQNPLLPFLHTLNGELPTKFDARTGKRRRNDDWLLWDLRRLEREAAGATLAGVRGAEKRRS